MLENLFCLCKANSRETPSEPFHLGKNRASRNNTELFMHAEIISRAMI